MHVFEIYKALLPNSKPFEWGVITRVYRYWREVALSTPSLWATIILPAKPDFVHVAIELSQNSFLHLDVVRLDAWTEPRAASALTAALCQMRRIACLSVHGACTLIKDCLPRAADASQLRSLHISGNPWRNGVDILDRLSGLSRLESLTATVCAGVWNALSRVPSLKCLVLLGIDIRDDATTLHQALVALRHLPRLEILSLPPVFDPEWEPAPLLQVALPKLQTLKFTYHPLADVQDGANLLANLEIPSFTQIDASELGDVAMVVEDLVPDILQVWMPLIPKLTGSKPLVALNLNTNYIHEALLQGWTDNVDFALPGSPKFALRIESSISMMDRLPTYFSLEAVRTLFITRCNNQWYNHLTHIQKLVPHLRNIERLRLGVVSTSWVSELLGTEVEDGIAFPKLHTLHLEFLNLGCTGIKRISRDNYVRCSDCTHALEPALKRRHAMKKPLKLLRLIVKKGLLPESHSILASVVEQVEVTIVDSLAGNRGLGYLDSPDTPTLPMSGLLY